jgi:hypothetical protein
MKTLFVSLKALLGKVPSQVYLYATLAAAVIAGYNGWAYHQREIGKRDVQIEDLEHANAGLLHARDSLTIVYRTDTLRLTKIRQVTDSLTVTVERWKHDTLKVVEYVTKADSTIRVCTAALQTCDQRVGVAQRGWDGARAEIKLLKASLPSPAQKWLYGAAGVGVGFLAGHYLK